MGRTIFGRTRQIRDYARFVYQHQPVGVECHCQCQLAARGVTFGFSIDGMYKLHVTVCTGPCTRVGRRSETAVVAFVAVQLALDHSVHGSVFGRVLAELS